MDNSNKKIGLYPLVGDLLHPGHILAIQEAKNNCDYLIVALNCNPDNKNPIQSVYERYIQLLAIKYIDQIIPYQGKQDLELLTSSLNYDIRFLGEDYKDKTWDGKEIELKLNKEIYFLKRQHYLSSSELKERILNQQSQA